MAISSDATRASRPGAVRAAGHLGDPPAAQAPPYHGFARLTAAATALLILAGALVTSHGPSAALSVPDWPTSFGTFFLPLRQWLQEGVRFEHTHRVIAGAVAVMMLVLGVWVVRREPRRGVRVLAAVAMGSVLLQALLGGLTVLLRLPHAVSASHGTLAQTFFCMVTALAMVTSAAWRDAPTAPDTDASRRLRALATLTTACVWLQLIVGAVTRHLHAWADLPRLWMLPPQWTLNASVHFAHRLGALLILALVGALAHDVLRSFRDVPQLRVAARRLGLLVAVQVLLGATIIWRMHPVAETSLHVLTGALVLATSLVLTLWTWRLFSAAASSAPESQEPT